MAATNANQLIKGHLEVQQWTKHEFFVSCFMIKSSRPKLNQFHDSDIVSSSESPRNLVLLLLVSVVQYLYS